MTDKITLRPFCEADRGALERIINETWGYGKFCSRELGDQLARAYLNSCLVEQTYTQVAVCTGVPVGVIMVKNIRTHRCPWNLKLDFLRSGFALLASKEGRQTCRLFKDVSAINRNLLKDSGKKYQGEISFFAIDAKFRGMGIGKKLFLAAKEYMKEEGIEDFYLFTDTSCNYPFYDHQGMKRGGRQDFYCKIKGEHVKMTFFLYES